MPTAEPDPQLEWFQKHRTSLMAQDYSPELSSSQARRIVHDYGGVLAQGGWIIRDAALLPYPKETIRAAIDRFIQDAIEENGGSDVPPTPELATMINTLGAVKWQLFFFQYVDPEDKEAIEILGLPHQTTSESEPDRAEFLEWWAQLYSKYFERVKMEINRLSADATVTVKEKKNT